RAPPNPTLFPYTTLFRSRRWTPTAASASWAPAWPGRNRRPDPASATPLHRPRRTDTLHPAGRACAAILLESSLVQQPDHQRTPRSEEHTSELQSRENLVC